MTQDLFFRRSLLLKVRLWGESFFLSVPPTSLWNDFLTDVALGRISDKFTNAPIGATTTYLLEGTDTDCVITYNNTVVTCNNLTEDRLVSTIDMGAYYFSKKKSCYVHDFRSVNTRFRFGKKEPEDWHGMGFRPMLIPLTKKGRFDESFAAAHPTGSILEGGYLKFQNENTPYIGCVLPGLEPPFIERMGTDSYLSLVEDPSGDAELYDVMEGPLKWWVYKGFLLGTSTVFSSLFASLFEMSVLPVLARRLPKN